MDALRSVIYAATAVLFVPATAAADPIELVDQREQFWLFDDVSGSVEQANWFLREPFLAGYGDVEAGFLAVHPDDSQFVVVFTTWNLPQGVGALYQAVANDVHGIGYEHIADLDPVIPAPYFDDTPDSQVQGFLHMNVWTQYLGFDGRGLDDTRISLIFGQELGHAWLAFPWYEDEQGSLRDDMLGRSDAHWSFYLHTGGSPVEGHEWVDNGDGTFTAIKQEIFTFSPLDLYLMGLVPPEDVEPFFLLEDVSNCVDAASGDGECAPSDAHQFQADSYTVNATAREITIEQVIASEGPRLPAFGDAPTEWDVSFLMIKRPEETLTDEELALVDQIVERCVEIFDAQTGGLGHVVNRTAAADPGGDDGDTGTGGATDGGDDDGTPADGTGDEGADEGTSAAGSATDAADGPGAGAGGDGSTDDGGHADDESGSGCGCTSGPADAAWWLAACVLLGVPCRRRGSQRV